MLVLSRRVGESLVIGDEIVITVLEFRGDVIRIGVDAPRHIQVRRQELLVELAETNRAAASPASRRGRGAVPAGVRRRRGARRHGTGHPGSRAAAGPATQPATQPAARAAAPQRPGPGTGPAPDRPAERPLPRDEAPRDVEEHVVAGGLADADPDAFARRTAGP